MLADVDINRALLSGAIRMEPRPQKQQIQPASIDVNLAGAGFQWRVTTPYSVSYPHGFYIDPSRDMSSFMSCVIIPPFVQKLTNPREELFLLQPHEFMLCYVKQHVWVPANMTAFLHGRSSLARYGLFIHITAGLLDAGWDGCATLELFNASPYAIRLWAGMSIATITFHPMHNIASRPYGHPDRRSKYQGDSVVVTSRYHTEIEEIITELEVIERGG